MKHAPAFPVEMIYTQENEKFNGMTLRDYFAAQAMQGFLGTVKVGCPDDLIAVDAYNLADAMLKAREA
jgi:hypothetical protein